MNRTRSFLGLSAAVSAILGSAITFGGCGDGTTQVIVDLDATVDARSDASGDARTDTSTDATTDATLDAGTDVRVDGPADGRADVVDTGVDANDAGVDADDAGVDAGPDADDAGVDAGPDADDAGVDAGPDADDAGVDAGPDADDAGGDVDAGPTLQEKLVAFQSDVKVAFCERLRNCCNLPPGQNQATCHGIFQSTGFEDNTGGLDQAGVVSSGRLVFNEAQAADCLAKIQGLLCPVATSADYGAAIDSCYAVITGTVAPGNPCNASIECAPGNYCSVPDGGQRVCVPLKGVGQSCGGDNAAWLDHEQCSTHGKVEPCDQGQCLAQRTNLGEACVTNRQCASRLCDVPSDGGAQTVCVASKDLISGGAACPFIFP